MRNTIVRSILKKFFELNNNYATKRYYSSNTTTRKEYTVPQFCNIRVKCPYSIKIEPVDLHKYPNNDRLILNVDSKEKTNIQCKINKEDIDIQELAKGARNVAVFIEVPVKANVNITTTHGNITLGNFSNEHITLRSSSGNISVGKCHSNTIDLSTEGNIQNSTVLQAANISIKTTQKGNIKMGRVQGLHLNVESERGDIEIESSYCNDGKFLTSDGKMDLKNIHQNCAVGITGHGTLNLSGLDGSLQALLNSNCADVHISRLLANSKIVMNGNGTLTLRLDEGCLDGTNFDIEAGKCVTAKNVVLNTNKKDNKPINMSVQCKNGTVKVSTFSWSEMFTSKFNKSEK